MLTNSCPPERSLQALYFISVILIFGGLVTFVAGLEIQTEATPILYDVGAATMFVGVLCVIFIQCYKISQARQRGQNVVVM